MMSDDPGVYNKWIKMIDITVQNKALKISWISFIFENFDSSSVQYLNSTCTSHRKHTLSQPKNTYPCII